MLAGYDGPSAAETEAMEGKGEAEGTVSLYWLDYMGSMQPVNFGIHGHAGNFVYSVCDNQWKPEMTEEEV